MTPFFYPSGSMRRLAARALPGGLQTSFRTPGMVLPLVFTVRTGFGFGRKQSGPTKRLSNDEKAARRATQNDPEAKAELQSKRDEAADYADKLFPEELDGLLDSYRKKAQNAAAKLNNIGALLEKMEVDIQGKPKPMSQLATVERVSGTQYSVTPLKSAFLSPIGSALMRLDSGLNVSREGAKLIVKTPSMTRERRNRAASEIEDIIRDLQAKVSVRRTLGMTFIEDMRLEEVLTKSLTEEISEYCATALETIKDELKDLQEEIITAEVNQEEDAENDRV